MRARSGSGDTRRFRPAELNDGVVRLSPLGLADVAPHLAGEDAELVRWLSGGVGTRRSVENYIRRCMAQWESGGPVHAFGIRVGHCIQCGGAEGWQRGQ